jgi:hypothetical protein
MVVVVEVQLLLAFPLDFVSRESGMDLTHAGDRKAMRLKRISVQTPALLSCFLQSQCVYRRIFPDSVPADRIDISFPDEFASSSSSSAAAVIAIGRGYVY